MIFATYWFPAFAAVFFLLFWIARPAPARLAVLLVACFTFHQHFAGAAGMWPIVILAALTYLGGLSGARWPRRAVLVFAVVALCVYKYSHFFALDVIGPVAPALGRWLEAGANRWLPLSPPLAISFFTFEFVHYLYDRDHGAPAIRSPADFAAFTFFFPSLVAGPIKRYQPFLESFHAALNRVSLGDVQAGLLRISVGYLKKFLIADNLTAAIDFWEPRMNALDLLHRWGLFGGIGIRILADFSGYSDIAIGLARMAGIRLPENFNWPYLATDLQDFWRRWHMSLSFWIRDYVYIPLGGSRRGVPRKILNGLIAFGLIGLWHGPAWHFVLWGVYHGLGLAIAANYRSVTGPFGAAIARVMTRVPALGWLLTLLFVLVGWLYFFYPVPEASHFIALLLKKS